MVKEIICTVCPQGCRIKVEGEGETIQTVEGYTCKRGLAYAQNEFLHPVRILTSTVKVENGTEPLVAVRTDRPVPKEKLFECMEVIRHTTVKAPLKRHTVIVSDICGTGANLVASGEMLK